MKTRTGFMMEGDTGLFDVGMCSRDKGWVRCETRKDASYYGIWANPTERAVFSYVEGDTRYRKAESIDEFQSMMRLEKTWHVEHGGYWLIDVELHPKIRQAFVEQGLSDVLDPVGSYYED